MEVLRNLIEWFLGLSPLAALVIGIVAAAVLFIALLTIGAVLLLTVYVLARVIKGLLSKEVKK